MNNAMMLIDKTAWLYRNLPLFMSKTPSVHEQRYDVNRQNVFAIQQRLSAHEQNSVG